MATRTDANIAIGRHSFLTALRCTVLRWRRALSPGRFFITVVIGSIGGHLEDRCFSHAARPPLCCSSSMAITPGLDNFNLDRLIRVPASEAIGGEATHFTPWLASHIDLLADSIHVGLRMGTGEDLNKDLAAHTEVSIGEYFLDIHARTDDDRSVAIENQYGRSDHKHLGQILTYAQGVEADVIVWVAEEFSDPHLAALRWLNRRTDNECGAFAVQLSFYRIGDSAPAPSLTCLVEPSETERVARKNSVAADSWTTSEFLSQIDDGDDRAKAEELVKRTLQTGGHIYCGKKPRGYIQLYPLADQRPTIGLCFNTKGMAMVSGLWTMYTDSYRDAAYSDIAGVLGFPHDGPANTAALADCDLDRLWMAAMASAEKLRDRQIDASA